MWQICVKIRANKITIQKGEAMGADELGISKLELLSDRGGGGCSAV